MFLDKKYMTNCYENNNIKINAIFKKMIFFYYCMILQIKKMFEEWLYNAIYKCYLYIILNVSLLRDRTTVALNRVSL